MPQNVQNGLKFLLSDYLKKNAFTACCVGVTAISPEKTKRVYVHVGKNSKDEGTAVTDKNSIFDLASLTKPLVVSLSVQALLDAGQLRLDDTLGSFFPGIKDKKKHITILDLLNHTAGFVPHRPYYIELIKRDYSQRKKLLIDAIIKEKLVDQPGTKSVYSDLGYILLGIIIEKVTQSGLEDYWWKNVVSPLKIENSLFFANQKKVNPKYYVSTGNCVWSGTELLGRVHDDNCRALNGVAGHAGLFGSVEGVLQISEFIINAYMNQANHPYISNTGLKNNIDNIIQSRRFGFDTPTGPVSSSGSYFSDVSIGHLGFTGTSFWLDCKKGMGIVLLTNRVLCSEELQQIRELRPKVHDAIMANWPKENPE